MLQRLGTWRAILPAILLLIGWGLLSGLTAPPDSRAAATSRGLPRRPASLITWQPALYLSAANGNLAPALHPTDPLRALLGGPLPLRYTTDGGASWPTAIVPPGLGQGVPAWLPGGNGQSALQVILTPGPSSGAPQFSRTTDNGAHWAVPSTLPLPNLSAALPYLWADADPASPYYGRLYLTVTLLDAAQTGSFDTVGLLVSTDQGATWNAPTGLVDPTEFGQGTNYNAFASAATQPGGGVIVAWHCGQYAPSLTNVPNKVMWSRSTDGGITFPVSGTIATVPVDQALPYNSTSPGGFRWTPAPNIAADPLDGTLYVVWIAYRQPGTPLSAATYLARSTDNGASWSAPVIVDDTQPTHYQFVPWVQVSRDHVVHVTYSAATTTVAVIAHFYAQSTDRGVTWSAPFSLNVQGHINGAVQGDFQATSVGGDTGAQGTILTAWEEENGTGVRVGNFPLNGGGSPSPTRPPLSPTRTPSPTPSGTATLTATRTSSPTPSGTATLSVTRTPCGLGWRVVAAPDTGLQSDSLASVAASGASDMWAVGYIHSDAGNDETLTVHWDGAAWSRVPSPNLPNYNGLGGVAARRPDDAWAVGYGYTQTLTLHWDGSLWNIVPSPAVGTHSRLYSVVALSSDNVWAVGNGDGNTLVEHWDGATWSVVPSPNAGGNNVLLSVAARSPGDIWAVGWFYNPGSPQTLALHWDGTAWTVVPSPNPGPLSNMLQSVAVTGSGEAWAVGSYHDSNDIEQTLTLYWAGTSWQIVPSPNPGALGNRLFGVAARAPNDLWAVGSTSAGADYQTLTLHGDGSAWEVVASPGTQELYAVAVLGPADNWAVGVQTVPTAIAQMLTLRYSEPCGTPTATPEPPTSTPVPPSPTACPIQFSDVDGSNPFYVYVRCLACRGIAAGYSTAPPCATTPCFLPGNNVTRGQMSKFIANAAGYSDPIPSTRQTFSDVPYGSPFWLYVERAALHGVISGYSSSPPCTTGVPCFLPGNNVTRGQAAKFAANAAGYGDPIPSTRQTFTDVPYSSPFWLYVERVYLHGVISGYSTSPPCSTGTPCFLPGNTLTRGQTAKIIANTFYPGCQTPARGTR